MVPTSLVSPLEYSEMDALSLTSSLPPSVPPKLAYALHYPMTEILSRYEEETGLSPDTCKEHEVELKRYLYLCSIYPERTLGMRGPVDELWHLFIIHTRQYHDFCNNLCGMYIHHSPTDPTDKLESTTSEYGTTLDLYTMTFASSPPSHIWPSLSRLVKAQDPCTACRPCKCERT